MKNYKYSFNINQKALVESGLMEEIDPTDPYILEFIIAFSQSKDIRKTQFNSEIYYWLNYQHILDQIPLIKTKPDAIYRRFKKYEKLRLLKAHPDNKKLGMSYYSFLPLLEKVTSSFESDKEQKKNKRVGLKTEGSAQKPEGFGLNNEGGSVSTPDNNTIKDNTIINKKEKEKEKPLDERSLLISQFRAKALTVELKNGNHSVKLFDWLTSRFPSCKGWLRKWVQEWFVYFVDARLAEGKDPLTQHPVVYKNSLENFILPKAQAEYKKTIKPVY